MRIDNKCFCPRKWKLFKGEPPEEKGIFLLFPSWAAVGGHDSWRTGSILNPGGDSHKDEANLPKTTEGMAGKSPRGPW